MRRALHVAGFTLVEIVLALAIIATAFVAILGLLPAGLEASRQAGNSTIVATVLDEVHQRIQQQPLKTGPLAFSPAFFDERGAFIPADAEPARIAQRFYRADVEIVEWATPPAHTSALRPVSVAVSWPVQVQTGKALGVGNPQTVVSYPVTTLTGPDWPLISPPGRADLKYKPRIEQ
jgi:uncharacterized protein (TIGR02598 family)